MSIDQFTGPRQVCKKFYFDSGELFSYLSVYMCMDCQHSRYNDNRNSLQVKVS